MKLETAGCLNGVRGVFRPKRAPRSLLGASVCRRSVRGWEFGDEVDSAVVEAVFRWDHFGESEIGCLGLPIDAFGLFGPWPFPARGCQCGSRRRSFPGEWWGMASRG